MAHPEALPDKAARIREVLDDCLRRRLAGEHLSDDAIIAAHPDLLPELAGELRKLALIQQADHAAEYAPTVKDDSAHPASPVGARPAPPSLPSDSFAGYELLREIHRGGQGVVYQALQKSTKRKVAIKVMKEGPFASRAEKARFEREVEVLGQLNHPNIVAVHDSGQAAGSFYFVMDYISGQPLDVWMAGGPRTIEETLRMFQKICEAVNAAHLRGVIHRDLKPGNIRIDENGEPHILDFGLAKVARGVEEASLMTMTGQFMGSLPWASPEQAEANPSKIDIRTDVYSLGVILYQMLTGKFPYDVIGNMRDVLDRIMKEEPTRPSTFRGTPARRKDVALAPRGQRGSPGAPPAAPSRRGGRIPDRIDDEVDTIVLKCLSKERERRYQSAGELARDLGHYLTGEPIEAKRDSALYVLRKQLRRYKLPVVAAAAFVILVTASLLISLMLWRQAVVQRDRALVAEHEQARERAQAVLEAAKAEAVNNFLQDMLGESEPWDDRAKPGLTVREVLDAAAAKIDAGSLKDQPAIEAAVRATIGETYSGLGLYALAESHHRASLAARRRVYGDDHPDVATGLIYLASAVHEQARLGEAEQLYLAALAIRRRAYASASEEVAECHALLGNLYRDEGRLPEAEATLRESLAIRRKVHGDEHNKTAQTREMLAETLLVLNKLPEAEAECRRALAIHRKLEGDGTLWIASCSQRLARILRAQGNLAETEQLYRESLAIYQKLLGESHPNVARMKHNIAVLLKTVHRPAEAEPLFREALDSFRSSLGGDHTLIATTLNQLAGTLVTLGRLPEAENTYREALAMYRRLLGDNHPDVANALGNLAWLSLDQGRFEEAESFAREAVAIIRRKLLGHWAGAFTSSILGAAICGSGRYAEAEPILLEAYQQLADQAGPSSLHQRLALERIVTLYDAWQTAEPNKGYDQKALEWRAKLAEWQASTQPADGDNDTATASQPASVPSADENAAQTTSEPSAQPITSPP